MKMQSNVTKMDAGARYIVGFGLLAVVILVEGPWRWAGLIGLYPIVTAILTWCPLYRLFGISTEDSDHEPQSRAL